MNYIKSKRILAIIVTVLVIAAVSSATLVYGDLHLPDSTSTTASICDSISGTAPSGFAKSNFIATKASFVVVESDSGAFEGMNGSYYHTFPSSAGYAGYNSTLQNWPVIQVRQNQTVSITITSCAASEPHGFAIGHYFNAGVTLQAGQSYTFVFEASQKGEFSMYCNTFCSIHPYMQNGLLIVS
ncbi:MAG: cupredoxin domain-containing protein [Nitrososphaerales archaeon]